MTWHPLCPHPTGDKLYLLVMGRIGSRPLLAPAMIQMPRPELFLLLNNFLIKKFVRHNICRCIKKDVTVYNLSQNKQLRNYHTGQEIEHRQLHRGLTHVPYWAVPLPISK